MKHTFCEATDRNKDPILETLRPYLRGGGRLLEIGTGNGQHAIHICAQVEGLEWVTSDRRERHEAIIYNLQRASLPSIQGPEALEIGVDGLPEGGFDYVYTANTLHIMPWDLCRAMFEQLGEGLGAGALVFFYGPFKYNNAHTTSSNQAHDRKLRGINPLYGHRSFEEIENLMTKSGFLLIEDHEMPVNNRLLVFRRMGLNRPSMLPKREVKQRR